MRGDADDKEREGVVDGVESPKGWIERGKLMREDLIFSEGKIAK